MNLETLYKAIQLVLFAASLPVIFFIYRKIKNRFFMRKKDKNI